MLNMFEYFKNNPNPGTSLAFMHPQTPANAFRGSIPELIDKKNNGGLAGIVTVDVCGPKISDGVYDSSKAPSKDEMWELMELLENESTIKELSFHGCKMAPEHGYVIAQEITKNKHLEKLFVMTNQLGEDGLIWILNGLQDNTALKEFNSRSYNCERYHWPTDMINSLTNLLNKNKTLQLIKFPDNQISTSNHGTDIPILSKPYKTINDRTVATVEIEFNLSKVVFNRENALNGELDELAAVRFVNHYSSRY